MNQTTWTKQDEREFQFAQARRDEVMAARDAKLDAAVKNVRAHWLAHDVPGSEAEAVAILARALKDRAYEVRAALEPYDEGPPVTEAAG
jgi:hypothetical protein